MTNLMIQAPERAVIFRERLDLLAEELELAIKWKRPCMQLIVCSSDQVRSEIETALMDSMSELGQRSVHLSVKQRDPAKVVSFLQELKDPEGTIFQIDGLRWGQGNQADGYSTVGLQREYFIEKQIRALFWLTENEIVDLAHAAPDFWACRHRVFEFVNPPEPEYYIRQAVDSVWEAGGAQATAPEESEATSPSQEPMRSEIPQGEESISIRGNLLLRLGMLSWRRGDFKRADIQLQEALRLATKIQDNRFEAECFHALALVKTSLENIDEAIDAYKQTIQLAPDQIAVWNNLGNLCAKIDRNDEAMIAFSKALEGNKRDPIAWNGLAAVHFKLGYIEEAIAGYRKAIQYTPTFAQPWCGLGDVYAATGRTDEASKCYHKAIELNKQYGTPWIRLAVLLVKQEKFREAIKAYQQALALDSTNSETWNDLGIVFMKSESVDEAAAAFTRAIELDQDNGWAYSNLAYAYMQQGRHEDTVSLLQKSIQLLESDADKAISWNRLAAVYRLQNDYDKAVAAYQSADKLNQGSIAANEQEAAIEAAPTISVVTDEPTPIQAYTTADLEANAASRDSQNTPVKMTSSGLFEPRASSDADAKPGRIMDAPAWIFKETSEQREAELDNGRRQHSPAQTGRKETTVTKINPVHQKLENKPTSKKVSSEGKLSEQGRESMDATHWTQKGNSLFNRGEFDEAIACYNTAIQLEPSYGAPYSNLALTYLTQGQCAEAILLYQKSIELLESDKDKAISWNGLGNAYRLMDDYSSAVTAYQRAAELDPETSGIRDGADDFQTGTNPKNAQAWNDLGELFLKTGTPDKAMHAFNSAIDLEPDSGPGYYNLARSLASQSRYEEAIPHYEKSIELLDDDKTKADACNGLGNAYRKLNDYENAIRAYQKAVVLADEGIDLLTRTRFSLLSNVYVNQ